MPILTAEERVGGTVGGRYRLESILGEGGTSTVYCALHTFTNRRVAVKLLKPQHARDADVVSRFLKEARVASTVVHPHVVAVLDMGTDDDCTYLVMELLAGESLAARLGRERLSSSEAVTLLRPLLEAVAVAHDKGIVHRDIKPENVLVGDRGDGVERAVLLDFGMAKTTEAAWGHMTQSGVPVGTPYYMSPEQAEGADDLGPPTDVWSMGVLLYRALSGDLPFTGTSPTSLLLAIARGEHTALEERAPDVPPPIAAWVEGALAADRAKRYPDMRAMLAALDVALTGTVRSRTHARSGSNSGIRSIPLEEVGLAPRSRAPMIAAIAGAITLAAGVAWLASLAWNDAPVEPAPIAAPELAASTPEVEIAEIEVAGLEVAVPSTVAEPEVAPIVEAPTETPRARGRERAREHAETPREEAPAAGSSTPSTGAPSTVPPSTAPPNTGLVTEW